MCMCLLSLGCLTLCSLIGLQLARILCSWNFPGKSTGLGQSAYDSLQFSFVTFSEMGISFLSPQ